MTYREDLIKTRKWYLSHELLCFERNGQSGDDEVTVWENLILIRANNPEEAYLKAIEHGRLNEQPVKIDGMDRRCHFLGLKDLVLVYDDLDDGAELEYKEWLAKAAELTEIATPKERLQAFNLNPENDGAECDPQGA